MLQTLKTRLLEYLGLPESALDAIRHEDHTSLHDPYLYHGMNELVDALHATPKDALIVVDTDYDTDGIMSACVLHAGLSELGFRHTIFIPSMADGYGLNQHAIDAMIHTWGKPHTILTADNGVSAFEGVEYANSLGIRVLVTDHHMGGTTSAPALALVNPNRGDYQDPYPFKGNAGATVAWKLLMAYAMRYQPSAIPALDALVVFAGIANVADVMPIIDENHYMVRCAVDHLSEVQAGRKPFTPGTSAGYQLVFQALAELIQTMQTLRDAERVREGKKPSKLPTDEQLISWYLSPLLNAPRRVHSTPREAFYALLHPDPIQRRTNAEALYAMNKEKSELRDKVLNAIDGQHLGKNANVLFVNTRHGIAGLIAGQIAERTGKPTFVFAQPTDSPQQVYGYPVMPATLTLSGSARSSLQPLPDLIDRIIQVDPDIVVGGGGHANAAGYSIRADKLNDFRILAELHAGYQLEEMRQLAESSGQALKTLNRAILSFFDGFTNAEAVWFNINRLQANDVIEYCRFTESLKPFGKDFEVMPSFEMHIDASQLKHCNYDPNFWSGRTFKASINGIEILTFDLDLAEKIKKLAEENCNVITRVKARISLNEFRGKVTPQIVLSAYH